MRHPAVFGVLLLVLAGCQTPTPALEPLSPDDPRPAELLRAWRRAADARQGLRGRARLAVDGAEGRLKVRGKQVLALERPGRLRVEVQGFLNQTVAVLVTDGERYELFRSDTRSYEDGPVHPDLLWEQAWIALAPDEAIDLLLGAAGTDPGLRPLAALGDGDGGVRLELGDGSGRLRRRLRFDPDGSLAWLEVFGTEGAQRWRADFDDYSQLEGVAFAHRIRLQVADAGEGETRAEIRLSDVELNPELSPDIFRLR